jgi:hypothetical protein
MFVPCGPIYLMVGLSMKNDINTSLTHLILKFTIEFVGPNVGFYKFNSEFKTWLYKDV